jgi:hypothetical protein
MPTKLTALVAVLLAATTLPAHADYKRSYAEKIDAFNTCEKNGGSVAVCCIAAGGTYDPGGYPAPGHPTVTIGESCTIAADASRPGGKKVVLHSGVSTSLTN